MHHKYSTLQFCTLRQG